MSDDIEAVGTAVEGALVGAVMEHEKSSGQAKDAEHSSCLNCGAPLKGSFCANCGQKAHIHRSLGAIWHDIAHGVLHFDGKLWRTLPMLAFKPGALTRRYIDGERANFISPMALFLFSIFLMFAIFSFTGGPGSLGDLSENLNEEAAKLDKEIQTTELLLDQNTTEDKEREKLEQELLQMKANRNGIAVIQDGKPIFADVESRRIVSDGSAFTMSDDGGTGWQWFDDKLRTGGQKAFKNPDLILYKLQSNGYKFAWLLIPLSLPFVWLVTFGAGGRLREYKFYDHAIFTTYSIAFMSLLFLTCALLHQAGFSGAYLAMLIVPPLHLYKQLKNAYSLSRIGAAIRLFLLLHAIAIIVTLFVLILVFLGLLG